jgi:hypothetical protein
MARQSKETGKSSAMNSRLGLLIEQLGPLNNRWREASPSERVLALWDMGDVILASAPNPSDALLWDIQQRSYITRNILRYALIVRRGWTSRSELGKFVEKLKSFTVFREALPFLKGGRAGIDDATYRRIAALLGHPDTTAAVKFLKHLKARRIGRQHKKGASVEGLREHAANFERALARLEIEVIEGSGVHGPVQEAVLLALSQVAMAMATGETIFVIPPALKAATGELAVLAEPMIAALEGGRASPAAFRKLVGGERLIQAADFLHSMRGLETLSDWRHRRAAEIKRRWPSGKDGGHHESGARPAGQ